VEDEKKVREKDSEKGWRILRDERRTQRYMILDFRGRFPD
jgi:hypothetical protein